jgi:hypothetical protein
MYCRKDLLLLDKRHSDGLSRNILTLLVISEQMRVLT